MSKPSPKKGKPRLVADNTRHGGLLQAARDFAVEQFLDCVKPVADEASKQIFAIADKAPSNEAQNKCFEASRAIKKNHAAFHKTLKAQINAQFAILAGATENRSEGQNTVTPSPGELRLVDDEKLERSLAISGMTAKIKLRFTGPLYLLKRRFSAFAARSTKPPFNPLGPTKLSAILADAVPALKLSTKFEVLYLKLMEKRVLKEIGDLYDSLNEFLAESGVLPNLKYEPPKREKTEQAEADQEPEEQPPPPRTAKSGGRHGSAPRGAGQARSRVAGGYGQAAAGGYAGGSVPGVHQSPGRTTGDQGVAPGQSGVAPPVSEGGRTIPGTAGSPTGVAPPSSRGAAAHAPVSEVIENTDQLLSDIRHLLSDQLAATTANLPPAPPVSQSNVQSALGSIAHQPSGKSGLYPPRKREDLWDVLQQQLREEAGNPDQEIRLTHEDATTVDLVGMLFDYVGKDVVMQPTTMRLLGPLQVPVLQVALKDPKFLGDAKHPARAVLNAVAELSNLLPSTPDPKDRAPMEVSALVRSAVDECPDPNSLFSRLNTELTGYVKTRKRKAQIAEKRHVQASKGKDRLMLSRREAQAVITKVIKKNRPPRFLRELLQQAWADVLSLTMLRHQQDSDYWRGATETAETIAELGRHPASKALVGRLARIWEPFHDAIEGGLRMVGMYPPEVEAVLLTLDKARAWAERGAPLTAVPRSLTKAFSIATGSKIETDVQSTSIDEPVADHLAEPLQELPREHEKSLEIIRKTPFGTWFDLTLPEHDTPIRAKLAWFSPVTDHCLFVNHRGVKCGPKSLRELAEAHASGTAVIITEQAKGMIDRALKAVLGKLRKLKERMTAGTSPGHPQPGAPQHA